MAASLEEDAETGGGRGFAAGFVTVMLVAAVAAALYLWREDVAAALPEAAGALQAYGAAVDAARAAIAEALAGLL